LVWCVWVVDGMGWDELLQGARWDVSLLGTLFCCVAR
jgi:hypothetical protein